MGKVTTAYLLTCAAIGVATGLLIIPATAFSTLTYATLPPLSALVAGAWVVGFVVAMRLVERPGAALLTGLISGLVAAPLSATGPVIVVTNVMFAAFIELPFLVTLYRRWSTWLHYAGALAMGVAYPLLAAQSFDLWAMAPGLVVGFIALCTASCIAGTFLAIVIADRLREAGVARLARRRPAEVPGVAKAG